MGATVNETHQTHQSNRSVTRRWWVWMVWRDSRAPLSIIVTSYAYVLTVSAWGREETHQTHQTHHVAIRSWVPAPHLNRCPMTARPAPSPPAGAAEAAGSSLTGAIPAATRVAGALAEANHGEAGGRRDGLAGVGPSGRDYRGSGRPWPCWRSSVRQFYYLNRLSAGSRPDEYSRPRRATPFRLPVPAHRKRSSSEFFRLRMRCAWPSSRTNA